MDLERVSRIPKRIRQDLRVIGLAKNWKEILSSKLSRTPLNSVRLRNGVVINSPAQVSLDFLFQEIWLDKVYSPAGYEIKPGDIVFDIGGNIGVFALYAATQAPNVKVYSYEPFPENAAFFEKNLKESQLKNINFNNLAVATDAGERTLEVNDSWIKHTLSDTSGGKQIENGITVKCVSLDEAMKEFDRCDLLKLDCEGSEYEILYAGSTETIGKIKKIVGEYHNLDNEVRNGESLRLFLEKNSFQIDIYQPLDDHSGFICAKRNEP